MRPREHRSTASSLTPLSSTIVAPNQRQPEIQMRLSSRYLMLASTYFKRMLNGPWKESAAEPDSRYRVQAEDWDADALSILINIIHGHIRSVPRSISLEMLAKVAVVVDYYDCYEVVELFSAIWIENLRHQLPKKYTGDLILCLLVSWVFSQPDIFKVITRIALMEGRGPLQTLNLPIPESVVGKLKHFYSTELTNIAGMIEQVRQESVNGVITILHDLLTYFRCARTACSFECSSILLGALTKELQARYLLSPQPTLPLLGYSFVAIARSARNIRSPIWNSNSGRMRHRHYGTHPCGISSFIAPIIDELEATLEGLTLEDFQR
jgi:hypothetical protein